MTVPNAGESFVNARVPVGHALAEESVAAEGILTAAAGIENALADGGSNRGEEAAKGQLLDAVGLASGGVRAAVVDAGSIDRLVEQNGAIVADSVGVDVVAGGDGKRVAGGVGMVAAEGPAAEEFVLFEEGQGVAVVEIDTVGLVEIAQAALAPGAVELSEGNAGGVVAAGIDGLTPGVVNHPVKPFLEALAGGDAKGVIVTPAAVVDVGDGRVLRIGAATVGPRLSERDEAGGGAGVAEVGVDLVVHDAVGAEKGKACAIEARVLDKPDASGSIVADGDDDILRDGAVEGEIELLDVGHAEVGGDARDRQTGGVEGGGRVDVAAGGVGDVEGGVEAAEDALGGKGTEGGPGLGEDALENSGVKDAEAAADGEAAAVKAGVQAKPKRGSCPLVKSL